MTIAAFATGTTGLQASEPTYRPGVCNIGADEIARRRRAGHIGLSVTVVLLLILIALGAPPLARLVVGLPAAIAASGYLQASFKFCAGFGSQGVFNFGQVGETNAVVDDHDRALDRARARRIGGTSLAIGLAVGIAAVILPV